MTHPFLARVRAIRAGKPAPTSPTAPTKATAPRNVRKARAPAAVGRLSCAELEEAIAAFTADLNPAGSTRQTIERLYTLSDAATDVSEIVTLDGPAPVTCAELDSVLDEDHEAPASAIRVLRRVRDLLGEAEQKNAAVGAEPVTRAEFDAFRTVVAISLANAQAALRDSSVRLDSSLEAVGGGPESFGLSTAEGAAMADLLRRIDAAARNAGARERRGESRKFVGSPFNISNHRPD